MRLRRQRLLVLAAAAGVLVVVLLPAVHRRAVRLAPRPGRASRRSATCANPSAAAEYKVTAWTLGDAASLKAAAAVDAVDEVDFDWYHTQADGSVTAQGRGP